jgi:ABC-type Fe3+-hydroxamate transport system substrate-binding protein
MFLGKIKIVVILFFWVGSAQAYERIVTLAPVISEWTALILGEDAAKKQIIAVSEYSHYPDYLRKTEVVGPYHQLNVEKIASLKPDLILGSAEYNRASQLEQLKRLQLPIRVLPKEKFLKMSEWVQELGQTLKEKDSSKQLATEWNQKVQELHRLKLNPKKQKMRFFLEIQHLPLVTIGEDSFLNDAFQVMGYENIFAHIKQSYPKVSKEAVLKENPDVIFVLGLLGEEKDFKQSKLDWEKLKSMKAVQNQEIRELLGDDFARCSLRLLKALKQLN